MSLRITHESTPSDVKDYIIQILVVQQKLPLYDATDIAAIWVGEASEFAALSRFDCVALFGRYGLIIHMTFHREHKNGVSTAGSNLDLKF